jgi:hypothetical protein
MVIALINRLIPTRSAQPITLWEQATHWWRSHILPGGLLPFDTLSSKQPSLETSAAMVPGLYRWGFGMEAQQTVDALLREQQTTGSWQNNAWITGQCLQALMADMRQCLIQGRSFRSPVERGFLQGCDWLYEQIQPDGRLLNVNIATWQTVDNQSVLEAMAIVALVPLSWAAKITNRPQYRLAVERALRYYLAQQWRFSCFSPYYAQLLWALDQLGQGAIADKLLLDLPLTTKGEVPAYANSHVVCVPALWLLSVVYYNLGHQAMGKHLFERALTYQQSNSGAFPLLSSGRKHSPVMGVAWYMQALDTFMAKGREAAAGLLPDTIAADDTRMVWLRDKLTHSRRLLEVQSGKGRYSLGLQQSHVGSQWHIIEPATQVIKNLQFPLQGREGCWQQMPYPNDNFDAVFGVDSLSHSVYILGALREASRVMASGAQLFLLEQLDAPKTPWRVRLTPPQWQDALMQAGFTVKSVDTLADGYIGIVAQRP